MYFFYLAGSVQSGGSSPSKVASSTTRRTHIPSASGIPRRNTYNYSENRTLSSTEKSGSQETSNRWDLSSLEELLLQIYIYIKICDYKDAKCSIKVKTLVINKQEVESWTY